MLFSSNFKHRFFNAFRELFVHHHGSLEFRAKILALFISVNINNQEDYSELIENIAINIYKNDINRANLLILTIQELVKKVRDNNGLDVDMLVAHIQNELKVVPRYAKKIDTDSLKNLLNITKNKDTASYQENILEFLETLKKDTLKKLKD
ncbi:MAG: hypothetical protein L3I99_05845 [Sulfurimonas sp.]|nr:hypothetical protein [Sulfurimonas sp.]